MLPAPNPHTSGKGKSRLWDAAKMCSLLRPVAHMVCVCSLEHLQSNILGL
jgi:hypothetical protein